MVLLRLRTTSSPLLIALLLAAGCGDEQAGDPIPDESSTLQPSPVLPASPSSTVPPSFSWDGGTLTNPGSGSTPDASIADAGGGSNNGGANNGSKADGGTPDASVDSGVPGFPDLGGILNPPKPDASTPPSSGGGAGTCGGSTPHGCYTPAANNAAGCPATSPEIPTGYPFDLSLWDGCNGLKVSAGGTCVWNGPAGATATCICDAGAHWICTY